MHWCDAHVKCGDAGTVQAQQITRDETCKVSKTAPSKQKFAHIYKLRAVRVDPLCHKSNAVQYSTDHDSAMQCHATELAAHQMQDRQTDTPVLRPTARAVVQPTVEYVTDMTAAMRDTSARELKFGNCTDTSHCKNQNSHSACQVSTCRASPAFPQHWTVSMTGVLSM